MAACITLKQLLQSLCKGQDVSGSAKIILNGDAPCQLFDPETAAWLPTGDVGTFTIGTPVTDTWTSCPIYCLDEITGPGGTPASELGFYYTVEVTIFGQAACIYDVYLDCAVLGLSDGDEVCLEDVILTTPTPGSGNPICDAIAACTGGGGGIADGVVTDVELNGTDLDFTGSDGGFNGTIDLSGLGGGATDLADLDDVSCVNPAFGDIIAWDGTSWICSSASGNETTTTLTNNNNGSFTYESEDGTTTTIDVCALVAGYCPDGLVDNQDGTYTHTAVDGTTTVIETGGCCSFSDKVCDPATGAVVYVTGVIDEVTGGFAAGPVYTNTDGSAFAGNTATLEACSGSSTGGSDFTCADLGSCSIEALGDVGPMVPSPGDVLTWNGIQWTNDTGGGTETPTTLIDNGDGTLTYTNELGVLTTFRSNDQEKITFAHRDLVTQVSCSGLDIDHYDREIYCISVTVETPPNGDEDFDLIDLGPNGTGNAVVYSGSLAAGTQTTGLIPVGPYLHTAGNLLQSNILSVAGSEKWTLHVFYRELNSELGV